MQKKIKNLKKLIASLRNSGRWSCSSTKESNGRKQERIFQKMKLKSLDEAIVKVEEAYKEDSKENIDKAVEELSKIAQPLI